LQDSGFQRFFDISPTLIEEGEKKKPSIC